MTLAALASQGSQRGRRPLRTDGQETQMNIDKDQILQLLRSQGKDDQASQAGSELPDKVDTGNAQHAGMLSKYGIDPSSIGDKLGGLGKLL
jgi:hypothetical protein